MGVSESAQGQTHTSLYLHAHTHVFIFTCPIHPVGRWVDGVRRSTGWLIVSCFTYKNTRQQPPAGDGTVPLRSLLRPLSDWAGQAGPQAGWALTHHTFEGVDHMDTMNYRPFFRALTDILADAVEHTPPHPAAAAAVRAPDWGWVLAKRVQSWDPVEYALDAAEKAAEDFEWPQWGGGGG